MQVVLPEENASHINEALIELCPTGALYYTRDESNPIVFKSSYP
jgi:hypothetical protein